MGVILFIVSSLLKWVLTPFAYGYGVIRSISRREFEYWSKDLARAKDQYGNSLCRYLFTDLLVTKGGYGFGNIDETISSVIGKNKQRGTLSKLGRLLDKILDYFDKNHSINSIDNTIKDANPDSI